ncbi:cystatin-A-like [Engystomops pustulosus]|uniref:cystatin-A-like n=1 Tax=Engystomops pustulosus TaxID=76066 RepID=UPI003AFB43A0
MAQIRECGVQRPPVMEGGLGAENTADPEVQELVDAIKPEFLKKSGINATKFKATKYKTQVVAGTNYFVKVDVGGGQFVHLRIFKPLPHTGEKPSLSLYQVGKTKQEPIGFF